MNTYFRFWFVPLLAIGLILADLVRFDSKAPAVLELLEEHVTSDPIHFVPNWGQAGPEVLFLARYIGQTLSFTKNEIVLRSNKGSSFAPIRLSFVGANKAPKIVGTEEGAGEGNFLAHSRADVGYTDLPSYEGLVYHQLYEGVDLHYSSHQYKIKRAFVVAPGAEVGQIRMAYTGVEAIDLRADGALVLSTSQGQLIKKVPYIYQDIAGLHVKRQGRYELYDDGQVGFSLGDYSPARPLVIDPELAYVTY